MMHHHRSYLVKSLSYGVLVPAPRRGGNGGPGSGVLVPAPRRGGKWAYATEAPPPPGVPSLGRVAAKRVNLLARRRFLRSRKPISRLFAASSVNRAASLSSTVFAGATSTA